ncbi:FCRL1 protein, partial [Podargus strigoides]|nr:FCRL1 protein [Podargus strigoides]
LQLRHRGRYRCQATINSIWAGRKESVLVTVTVRGVPVSGVSLVAEPPDGQVVEGDRLVLGCGVAAGTGPLSFSWHRQGLATPLATGASYELRVTRHENGSRYHCTASNGGTAADSAPLRVTVL